MGNRIVAGRDARPGTTVYNTAPVVVVTENFAREYWKDPALALGRRIRNTPNNPWRTIVGVVGDERDDGVDEAGADDRLLADGGEGLLDEPSCSVQRDHGATRSARERAEVADAAQGSAAGGLVGEPAACRSRACRRSTRSSRSRWRRPRSRW